MGLDMYLTKKTFIWTDDRKKITFSGINHIKSERIEYVIEAIGYWRKANAIHKWFVENAQEGEDNCKEYYIDREKLEKLLVIVNEVSKNHSLAKTLLPTCQGFFFGRTEYDDWYFDDIEKSKEILKIAIEESQNGNIYYQSNW